MIRPFAQSLPGRLLIGGVATGLAVIGLWHLANGTAVPSDGAIAMNAGIIDGWIHHVDASDNGGNGINLDLGGGTESLDDPVLHVGRDVIVRHRRRKPGEQRVRLERQVVDRQMGRIE